MIATCTLCKQLVKPAVLALDVRQQAAQMGIGQRDRLQIAMMTHLAEHHQADAQKVMEVGNLMSLWAVAGLFTSSDPGFERARDQQANVLINLILGPDDGESNTEPAPSDSAEPDVRRSKRTLQKGSPREDSQVVEESTLPPAA